MTSTKTVIRSQIAFTFCFVLVGLNLRPSLSSVGPLSDMLRNALSIQYSDIGLLISIPTFFIGLFALLISYLRLRNEVYLCILAISCIGIATAARFFTNSFTFLLVTALICGFGIAVAQAFMPGIIKTTTCQTTATKQMARFSASILTGAALAAAVTPWIADITNDWRMALSLPGFLALPSLFFLIRLARSAPVRNPDSARPTGLPRPDKTSWLLALYFGLSTSLFTAMLAWLPALYIDIGWKNGEAGRLMAYFISCEIIGSLYIPRLFMSKGDRRYACWFSLLCIGAGLLGVISTPDRYAVAWVGMLGLGIGAMFPLTLLLPLDRLQGSANMHFLLPFVQGIGYLIASAAPYAMGVLRQNSTDFKGGMLGLLLLTFFIAVLTKIFTPGYLLRSENR